MKQDARGLALSTDSDAAALDAAVGAYPGHRTAAAEALRCWLAGKLEDALAAWEAILARAPTDILTIRLVHFLCCWLGEARGFLRETLAAGSASPPRRFYAAAETRGPSASP